jgi:copper homeostasis protein (lipoprotein)
MRTNRIIGISLLTLIALWMLSCQANQKSIDSIQEVNPTPGDNSRNALDWEGMYRAILPCEGCEGVETVLILSQNGFRLRTRYIGRSEQVFIQEGQFEWDSLGGKINLVDRTDEGPAHWKVGEGRLIMLNDSGEVLMDETMAEFVLYQLATTLYDTRWKLYEINGKRIGSFNDPHRHPYLIINSADNRAYGNGGCNGFTGVYSTKDQFSISFSKMASTKMACEEGLELEIEFMTMLEKVDNYTMRDDTLSLNKAKMAPLARFIAVYE